MIAELEGAPQPDAYYRAMVDGQAAVVRIVTCSDTTVVCNPTSGPQRVINRADILGPAEDPFTAEPHQVALSEPEYLVPRDQMAAATVLEPLTEDEEGELVSLEAEASDAFDAIRESGFEAGRALWEISEKRLYRATHGTFEDYCRERWEIGRAQAYSLMDFAKVRGALSARADMKALPENAKQVRELKAAGELAPEAWLLAVERKGGEQPTAREVAQAVEDVRYDYHGHQVGQEVWWFEAETLHVRAGVIERLHRGEFLVRPTDGGGPKLAFPLPFERIGKGNQPGPATPFGICGTCRSVLTGRDHCPDCHQRLARGQECTRLRSEAEDAARQLGHTLGDWVSNDHSPLIAAAKCTGCGGGVSLFGNENPPSLSTSPKLKTQCVPVVRPADGRVDPETAPCDTDTERAAIATALKGLPAGEVLGIYGRVRRAEGVEALVRAGLARADLDRRNAAGIDLPWCPGHDDYSTCLECEKASGRVVRMAETAGLPEIAGELQAAAGIQPPAEKPGFLKSAAEKVAEKLDKPAAPATPKAWDGKTQAVISNAIAERLVTLGAGVEEALTGYCELFAVADEFGVSTEEAVSCLKRFLAACCDSTIDPDNVIDAIPGIARDLDAA